ncbi:MAG TPA: MgtC/SapB family protein [Candidatus Saccharibacteria bacterium]|nr:MgtC/SapB family protein [Candidatus Saccharibacteria bacterium]HMT56262.1 MgtC/SapB family protein [Candidatus Saccharibacteria bacterium]
MFDSIITARETEFIIDLLLAFICGALIGGERELKGKPAGISTQTLVISGAMLFAFLSRTVNAGDPTRIAAQIVSGIGFLGAGIILKSEAKNKISNVTTAASIWYSAAIGMALGFNMHFIAVVAALYAVIVSRLPHLNRKSDD